MTGDIEAVLSGRSQTATAIYDMWEKRGNSEPRRMYLGASIIGSECARKLWLEFRWCARERFDGRLYRLFNHGNVEEDRIVKDLRDIGCTVHATNEDGSQFGVSAIDGHFRGHMDGVVLGLPEAPKTWHLLECKTANTKSFRDIEKRGVQDGKPQHYAQMQIYMHLADLTRAIYMVLNKDDERLYVERVHYDAAEAKRYLRRAETIIRTQEMPSPAGDSTDHPACRYCSCKNICYRAPTGVALPIEVSCRSCLFAEACEEGHWKCGAKGKTLSRTDQEAACEDHLCLPDLIPFAVPEPVNNYLIQYINEGDMSTWLQGGREPGAFTTVELTKTPISALHGLTAERIAALKTAFGGRVEQ